MMASRIPPTEARSSHAESPHAIHDTRDRSHPVMARFATTGMALIPRKGVAAIAHSARSPHVITGPLSRYPTFQFAHSPTGAGLPCPLVTQRSGSSGRGCEAGASAAPSRYLPSAWCAPLGNGPGSPSYGPHRSRLAARASRLDSRHHRGEVRGLLTPDIISENVRRMMVIPATRETMARAKTRPVNAEASKGT